MGGGGGRKPFLGRGFMACFPSPEFSTPLCFSLIFPGQALETTILTEMLTRQIPQNLKSVKVKIPQNLKSVKG